MAYSEKLAERLRQALAGIPNVEEKKMFGGLAFMVNGKMCLTAGKDRIMCRIDPNLPIKGCTIVIMGGREYKGYVHVDENNLKTKADLDRWVALALDFNKEAKVAVKKHRR